MDPRVRKIRRNMLSLSLSGIDVMFVAENPEHPVGEGATFLFGSVKDEPIFHLAARRLLNELKQQLDMAGLELSYTIAPKVKEANE